MKKIKKIICLFVIYAFIVSMNPVFASESTTVKYSALFNIIDNSFSVSGEFVNEKRGNVTVGLQMKDKDGKINYVTTTSSQRKDNSVGFTFGDIPLENNFPTGKYTIDISSFIAKTSFTVDYMNIYDKLELMKQIEQETDENAKALMLDNGGYLCLDTNSFEQLSDSSQKQLVSTLCQKTYNFESCLTDTPNEIKKTALLISEFVNDFSDNIIVGKFNDCSDVSSVSKVLSDYSDILLLDKDDVATNYDEKLIYELYKNANLKNEIALQLSKIKSEKTISDIKNDFYEKTLCASLNSSHISNVDYLIETYKSAFGIDTSKYFTLKVKDNVKNGLIGTNIYTYDGVKTKFNTLVDTQKNLEIQSSVQGGSGGGGGGGISHGLSDSYEVSQKTDNALMNTNFDDIENVTWAKDAILYLYTKGIISGKETKKFVPNDNITRAEFIKILIGALEIPVLPAETFGDVDSSKWYSGYMYTAKLKGLINGDDKGNFCPDDYITREDITVILYRAQKIESSITDNTFSDFKDVSDYAKLSVCYYSHIGVINGMPDGKFAPKNFATRAQVAKIIYSAIK